MILEVGHLFKYKFKPWEATKILKCVNKWLPIIGGIVDLLSEFADQQKSEEARNKLRQARQEMVLSFNSIADQFEQDGINFIEEKVIRCFQDIIDEYSDEAGKLDALKKNKTNDIEKLHSLIQECKSLQREIRRNI
jgi:hypothetical protein